MHRYDYSFLKNSIPGNIISLTGIIPLVASQLSTIC